MTQKTVNLYSVLLKLDAETFHSVNVDIFGDVRINFTFQFAGIKFDVLCESKYVTCGAWAEVWDFSNEDPKPCNSVEGVIIYVLDKARKKYGIV